MTPARWQHVREILYGASRLEPPCRHDYVVEVCGSDRELRSEVEELLGALGECGDFLESPIRPTEEAEALKPHHTGRRVGGYQLLEEIGRGGMGEVYRAFRVDGQFEKEVAVKLVRTEWGSPFLPEQFRRERQVLARLEHPNIARLLDCGTTEDGVAYLVMELIEGTPIDQYCSQHELGTDARLQLFLEICGAVQYAHQHMVIHRDIKPANILVTGAGVPKLLDFGIAKIIDPAGGAGTTLLLPMTPEYASPEQIRGDGVTTASDVYSLGMLLYVLLTGGFPYRIDRRNLAALARATAETEPDRPSDVVLAGRPEQAKLHRRLRGDLDAILLKALRKEPQHRYASVEQLAEDLRHEMQGRPVRARRGSWNYRAGKFLRRHKISVGAAVLAGLALVGGVSATVREARIAAANARRAEQRFNEVRGLATSNLFELNDALEKLPASAPARHLLIQRALEYLGKLRSENSNDRDLLREMATAYQRIAQLQGRFTGSGVGDVRNSVASYQNALAIRSRLVEISRQAPEELLAEVRLQGDYTRSLLLAGQLQQALASAQTGLALSQQLMKARPQDSQVRLATANAHIIQAWVFGGSGSAPNTRELDQALIHDRVAIDLLQPLSASDPQGHQRAAIMRLVLGMHYWKGREFEKSRQVLDSALAVETKQSMGAEFILHLYNWRGHTFVSTGDHARALQDYHRGLQLAESMAGEHPDDMDALLDLDIMLGLSAIEEARLGNPRRALTRLNQALTGIERLYVANPEPFYQRILLVGYSFRGEIDSMLGDQSAARANLARCLAIAENLAQADSLDLDSRLQMARAHTALGVLWTRSSGWDNARRELTASLSLARQLLAARPSDPEARFLAGTVESHLAALAGCESRRPCGTAHALPLPSLIE